MVCISWSDLSKGKLRFIIVVDGLTSIDENTQTTETDEELWQRRLARAFLQVWTVETMLGRKGWQGLNPGKACSHEMHEITNMRPHPFNFIDPR